MTKNIALIDNDLILYSEMKEQKDFEENHSWHHFKNVEEFRKLGIKKHFDLMIVNEPDDEKLNIKEIISPAMKSLNVPAIVLFSRKTEKEKTPQYLEVENISFIKKPFRLMSLLMVIRNKFELQESSKDLSVRIGPYLFKPLEKVILGESGEKLFLTDTEAKILRILSNVEGIFVRKNVFLEEVWGIQRFLDTHKLETHIYRLRKKFQKNLNNNLSIISNPAGYSLEYKDGEKKL